MPHPCVARHWPVVRKRCEEYAFELKTAWSDGTRVIFFSSEELVARLAALVPPPRMHLVHYLGVLAPNAKLCPLVVPDPRGDHADLWCRMHRGGTRRTHRPLPLGALGGIIPQDNRRRCIGMPEVPRAHAAHRLDHVATRDRRHPSLRFEEGGAAVDRRSARQNEYGEDHCEPGVCGEAALPVDERRSEACNERIYGWT